MEEKDQTLVHELFDSNPRFRMLFEEQRKNRTAVSCPAKKMRVETGIALAPETP
jgi:hypothetical protein